VARNLLPVVGWTGSSTTVRYLTAIAPALRELRRRIDFELLVIGSEIQLPGLKVRCVPWQSHSEVADLRLLDVGLMPLEDDEWSRGKCGMKALQYMALGIPPVVSPVGVNAKSSRMPSTASTRATNQNGSKASNGCCATSICVSGWAVRRVALWRSASAPSPRASNGQSAPDGGTGAQALMLRPARGGWPKRS
jgi:hypothetical protein